MSLSYRQVCRAYPSGGGAYVVARENLSQGLGLVAAAALLIDYVMTVAVSTASAVAQVYSVIPALYDIRIEIAILSIVLITVANLRGLREAGLLFASPTYLFVGLALLMIGVGLFKIATGQPAAAALPDNLVPLPTNPTEAIGILLLLRAFAGGSVALTGVEAIANGVPAFKPPEAKNAANTMLTMAILLGVLFIGITIVADGFGIRPTVEGGQTVVAMVAAAVFGDGTPLFVAFQAATALILFLAVNTSFNAFPRLAAILAEDGFMPHQFAFRGDRLAFSWGIVVLATIAGGPPDHVRRRHARPHPAVLRRRLRVLHAVPGRHGPPLVHRAGVRLAVAGAGERVRRRPHARRARGRRVGQVRRRRVARGRADPDRGRPVPVRPPPVRGLARPPRAPGRPGPGAAAPHRAGGHPGERGQPGGRPGGQRGSRRSPTTCGPSS